MFVWGGGGSRAGSMSDGLISLVRGWGQGDLFSEVQCIVGNVTWGPPVNRQTWMKTLPSRNFGGGWLIKGRRTFIFYCSPKWQHQMSLLHKVCTKILRRTTIMQFTQYDFILYGLSQSVRTVFIMLVNLLGMKMWYNQCLEEWTTSETI